MTRLLINSPVNPCVLYGERPFAERMCDQMLLVGAPIREIILKEEGAFAPYRGVPVFSKERMETVTREDIDIVPAVKYFGSGRKELRAEYDIEEKRVSRDIKYLAQCVAHAEVVDAPPVGEATDATLVALQLGFVMGGVETWVSNLYHELTSRGVQTRLLEQLQDSPYQYVGSQFYGIAPGDVDQIKSTGFIEDVLKALALICAAPPRVYVDNGSYRLLAAVYLAKKRLGLDIKVISVLHGDVDIVYDRMAIFDEIIDKMVAVSDPIREKIIELFPHRANDVQTKLQIPAPSAEAPDVSAESPLRIAYAARLEPSNKRSLWLIDVMDGLMARGIDFTLDIAGDGDCFAPLSAYIAEKGLQSRARMLGSLPHDQMEAFWRAHQVFVNFSLSEGGPLTLLEAMGQGLAPVVTDAGCGKRLIESGKNGVLIASPKETIDALAALANDPARLCAMRHEAWQTMRRFAEAEGQLSDAFIL